MWHDDTSRTHPPARRRLKNHAWSQEDFTTENAKAEEISKRKIYLTISEGKFHQVKRMLEYVGNEVVELKRVSIGNLSLDEKLELGEYREITNTELEEIFK